MWYTAIPKSRVMKMIASHLKKKRDAFSSAKTIVKHTEVK
jgi:anthranilate/para-aminobenzoate synthase component I